MRCVSLPDSQRFAYRAAVFDQPQPTGVELEGHEIITSVLLVCFKHGGF